MDRVDVEQWKGREVARLLALVETERRYYQEIVASLPVGLAVVTREGIIQSANRAFRQVFQLRPEDVHRRTLAQLITSVELQKAIKEMPSSGALSASFQLHVGDRHVRVSAIPVRDWDNDSDIEILLALEDLTGVGATPLPHDAPAMIWTANAETMEFSQVAGEDSGAIHPGFNDAAIHPDDRDRVLEFYREALASSGHHACEYRAVNPQGDVVWFRDAFSVAARNGSPRKAAGVVTEITDRRHAEQMAQQATRLEALASLARTLTHDLNNPLMIVTGYGEDVMASLDGGDSRRNDVQEILTAAERIGGITNHLIEFTRKQANPPQPVQVLEAVRRALGATRLETRVPANLRVMADGEQLGEALAAILGRMRQDGKVTVEAKAVRINEHTPDSLAHGDYIDIVCAAPGNPGISFDSLIPGKECCGPKLARAHSLIREWGGGVWQSPGEVHVLIPAAAPVELPPPVFEPEPEPTAVLIPIEEPRAAVEDEKRAETILVVEDEGGIRALVRKILRRQNYEVLEAASADEALAIVAGFTGRIDLLITDMTLPGRSGRQLAEQLKGTLPDLKLMYVSGYTDDPAVYDRDQLPAGAAFLQKPFTLGSLLKKVREVLDANA